MLCSVCVREEEKSKQTMVPPSRAVALLSAAVALLAVWGYHGDLLLPPPPKLCGTPGGPPVVSPRIRLRDGRHLAYRESGVPRAEARHRVVVVHGLADSKDFTLSASPELVEELGVYFVCFDRAGYGESDPHPGRTVKSAAMDVQELADQLELGERFYVVGASIGGYAAWSCIKHIPHRLAGVALFAPGINYWWPSLPAGLANAAFRKLHPSDRRAFWVARHAPPWLFYAYMTQKLVMPSAAFAGLPYMSSRQDREILETLGNTTATTEEVTRQGIHESLYRDLMVALGDWGFEPMELADPFPRNKEGGGGRFSSSAGVHLWQGGDDRILDPEVKRFIARKLPWIRYHECSDCGHLFVHKQVWSNAILRALVLGRPDQEEDDEQLPKPSAAAAAAAAE